MSAEAGEQIVTVTWLEMTERPAGVPPMPLGQSLALVAAERPPVDYFIYLYERVGRDWHWTDWLEAPEAEQAAFCQDPAVVLYTLMTDGWPGGFFMLDWREAGTCDLAYFGLMPEAVGRGLGRWFLGQAISEGWSRDGVGRMTVNTCTLDHPRALGLYQSMGFVPVRRTTRPMPAPARS